MSLLFLYNAAGAAVFIDVTADASVAVTRAQNNFFDTRVAASAQIVDAFDVRALTSTASNVEMDMATKIATQLAGHGDSNAIIANTLAASADLEVLSGRNVFWDHDTHSFVGHALQLQADTRLTIVSAASQLPGDIYVLTAEHRIYGLIADLRIYSLIADLRLNRLAPEQRLIALSSERRIYRLPRGTA